MRVFFYENIWIKKKIYPKILNNKITVVNLKQCALMWLIPRQVYSKRLQISLKIKTLDFFISRSKKSSGREGKPRKKEQMYAWPSLALIQRLKSFSYVYFIFFMFIDKLAKSKTTAPCLYKTLENHWKHPNFGSRTFYGHIFGRYIYVNFTPQVLEIGSQTKYLQYV